MRHDLTTRIPFAFARSALFRPGERGPDLVNADIEAAADYKISINYSGPSLTSCHATAWQALVALAYQRNAGTAATLDIKAIDILRAMGRSSVQTHAKRWLYRLLDELTCATTAITTPRQHFHGQLVACVSQVGNGWLRITFDPALDLFLQDEVVRVRVRSRHQLTAHPLALWLHDYIATHQKVYEVPVKTLHRLCQSSLTTAVFRKRLREALEAVKASGPTLTHYTLEKGVLTLHKQRTSVLLLKPTAVAAKQAASWHQAQVQEARKWRARVPL